MARESVRAILRDVPAIAEGKRPRRIANNTVEYFRPPQAGEFTGTKKPAIVRALRLHHTDIIVTDPETGNCELRTGGWQTVTTADRIRRYSPAHLYSKRGQWYVGDVPFFEGIRVAPSGAVLNAGPKADRTEAKRKATLAKIKKFCAPILDPAFTIPAPSPGDCLICQCKRETPGELQFNCFPGQSGPDPSDCVNLHVNESYLDGSLVRRALEHQGHKDPALIYRMGLRDTIHRALRAFCKRKLGVG